MGRVTTTREDPLFRRAINYPPSQKGTGGPVDPVYLRQWSQNAQKVHATYLL
jgi:hypothetical protein